ncbi:MAG: hypothetical protein CME36_12330 [unclassified Hahellaceae]|nr:hypothetical protein [Hahellaceae bacterium]|tara:strand:- start:105446 stop:107530 length:2085 start_codon:yes stop_codon:yes gene_type:complete
MVGVSRESFINEQSDTLFTLRDFVSSKTLDITEIRRIFLPVLKQLALLHQRGLVHRAVNPDTIYRESNGQWRLLPIEELPDSESPDPFDDRRIPMSNAQLDPDFAPIEQFSVDLRRQGPWTDIYSVAGTMYLCIAGHTPVGAKDRVASGEPYDKDIDPLLWLASSSEGRFEGKFLRLIDKGLTYFHYDRPQTIEPWAAALFGSSALANTKLPATRPKRPVPVPVLEESVETGVVDDPAMPGQVSAEASPASNEPAIRESGSTQAAESAPTQAPPVVRQAAKTEQPANRKPASSPAAEVDEEDYEARHAESLPRVPQMNERAGPLDGVQRKVSAQKAAPPKLGAERTSPQRTAPGSAAPQKPAARKPAPQQQARPAPQPGSPRYAGTGSQGFFADDHHGGDEDLYAERVSDTTGRYNQASRNRGRVRRDSEEEGGWLAVIASALLLLVALGVGIMFVNDISITEGVAILKREAGLIEPEPPVAPVQEENTLPANVQFSDPVEPEQPLGSSNRGTIDRESGFPVDEVGGTEPEGVTAPDGVIAPEADVDTRRREELQRLEDRTEQESSEITEQVGEAAYKGPNLSQTPLQRAEVEAILRRFRNALETLDSGAINRIALLSERRHTYLNYLIESFASSKVEGGRFEMSEGNMSASARLQMVRLIDTNGLVSQPPQGLRQIDLQVLRARNGEPIIHWQ